jgi:hypothetical protein
VEQKNKKKKRTANLTNNINHSQQYFLCCHPYFFPIPDEPGRYPIGALFSA